MRVGGIGGLTWFDHCGGSCLWMEKLVGGVVDYWEGSLFLFFFWRGEIFVG